MEKKLKFSKPVITRIKLDPEQAVLAECMVNGAYYGPSAVTGAACYGVGGRTSCFTPKRGVRINFTGTGTTSGMSS